MNQSTVILEPMRGYELNWHGYCIVCHT